MTPWTEYRNPEEMLYSISQYVTSFKDERKFYLRSNDYCRGNFIFDYGYVATYENIHGREIVKAWKIPIHDIRGYEVHKLFTNSKLREMMINCIESYALDSKNFLKYVEIGLIHEF